MTNAQVVALGIRLFCIWLAVYVLRYAPAMWELNATQLQSDGAAGAVIAVTAILITILIGLWLFPLAAARKLLPQPSLDHPTALPVDQLQSAGFCLLGLWLLTEAIPSAFYDAFILYYASRPNTGLELQPQNYAAMARVVIELGLGIWLLFGGKGLLGVIRWARTAGTVEPSNNVVETDARQERPRVPHHER